MRVQRGAQAGLLVVAAESLMTDHGACGCTQCWDKNGGNKPPRPAEDGCTCPYVLSDGLHYQQCALTNLPSREGRSAEGKGTRPPEP